MKRGYFLKLFIFFIGFFYLQPVLAHSDSASANHCSSNISNKSHRRLIDLNSQSIANTLSAILASLQITHTKDISNIKEAFQALLRKPGEERWQLKKINVLNKNRKDLLHQLKKLELDVEISPQKKHFEHAVILGATAPTIQKRLANLVKLWQEGVRFNELVFLVSKRKLTPAKDITMNCIDLFLNYTYEHNLLNKAQQNTLNILNYSLENDIYIKTNNLIKEIVNSNNDLKLFKKYFFTEEATENDASKAMDAITYMPKDMRKLPKLFVDTPNVQQDGLLRRANTKDSLLYWLDTYKPQGKSMLVVSNQPHATYQLEVVRNILKGHVNYIDVSAYSDTLSDDKIELYLDTLALFLKNSSE